MHLGANGNRSDLADTLARLGRGAQAFASAPLRQRAELLAACRSSLHQTADAWVATHLAATGWQTLAEAQAEAWASGPLPVARTLRLHEARLHAQRRGEPVRLPATTDPLGPAPPGSAAVAALPSPGLGDRLFLHGVRATVLTTAPPQWPATPSSSGLALVLGAGNVTATPLLDALDQVCQHGRAALVKLSPLHAPLLPQFAAALAPLVAADLLAFATGDGAGLPQRTEFAAVHLTGAARTWAELRAAGMPAPVQTAELGCCTPAFVLPGRWPARGLRHAAQQLAAYVACNGGATCLAPRLCLTARDWPQRAQFLAELRAALAALPARVPFHPGIRPAYEAALGRSSAAAALAPALRTDLPLDSPLLACEPFAPVLLELPLPGAELAAWLDHAVATVRERVYGALSAYVFAPAALWRRADRARLRRLPHLTLAVNTWAGLGYGLGTTPWGVPDGMVAACGVGRVHGAFGPINATRVVVQAPLRPRPQPPWWPGHRHGAAVLRHLTRYYLDPRPRAALQALARALAAW